MDLASKARTLVMSLIVSNDMLSLRHGSFGGVF